MCVCFLHEGDASHFTSIACNINNTCIHAMLFIFLENMLNYFMYFAVVTGLIELTELNQFSYPLIYLLESRILKRRMLLLLKS